MVWSPQVTVAAVIEQQGRFLLVEETTEYGLQFNQPAGHLEAGEDLLTAIKREVFEETAWQFEPEALLSVQLWRKQPTAATFMRFCFTGQCHSYNPVHPLDTGIVATHWLSHAEVAAQTHRLRSPLVLHSIEHYVQGQRYPLSLLHAFINFAHE